MATLEMLNINQQEHSMNIVSGMGYSLRVVDHRITELCLLLPLSELY